MGSLAAGAAASAVGVRGALVIVCALASLTPAVVLTSTLRQVRTLEDLDEPAAR